MKKNKIQNNNINLKENLKFSDKNNTKQVINFDKFLEELSSNNNNIDLQKRKLDPNYYIENIAKSYSKSNVNTNIYETENNVMISLNINDLNENEKLIFNNYIKEKNDINFVFDIKKMINNLIEKDNKINNLTKNIENTTIDQSSINTENEKKYNEIYYNFENLKNENNRISKLLENKNNKINELEEKNKKLNKEKYYLINELANLKIENKKTNQKYTNKINLIKNDLNNMKNNLF